MRRRECEAWQLLQELLRAHRTFLPMLVAEYELSPAQWHVLQLIAPDEPLPMGELARDLACDASNVTGLVDRLEARRLVERRAAPHDRRVKVIALTRQGGALRARIAARLAEPPGPIARLSAFERRQLSAILRKALGS
jgi:DNA-binding MarR family transcriptional regulator